MHVYKAKAKPVEFIAEIITETIAPFTPYKIILASSRPRRQDMYTIMALLLK